MLETIEQQLTMLGNRILKSDKAQKKDFDELAPRCKHRELSKYASHRPATYACKSHILKDPQFGWSCDMGNCPYMNGAMDWRANNT